MATLQKHDVGVIVGRFQVPSLHEGHRKIIQEVLNRHSGRCIIFIGVSPTLGTKENPLDFVTRRAMIEQHFPNVVVAPLMDNGSDEVWSRNLDNAIKVIYPLGKICLYGGRDSFVKCYKGQFDAYEFPTHDYRPGTEIRAEIGKTAINSDDFRAGVIYSTQNQYKRTHVTIDVCPYRRVKNAIAILLGRKYDEDKMRLIGGFVEGEPLEEAVRREASEEANVELGEIEFVCSSIVNDWRYEGTSDNVLTVLFASEVGWGGCLTGKEEKAGDDLADLTWCALKQIDLKENIMPVHRPLIQKLFNYFDIKTRVKKEEDSDE